MKKHTHIHTHTHTHTQYDISNHKILDEEYCMRVVYREVKRKETHTRHTRLSSDRELVLCQRLVQLVQ